jgi:hypothetical protein
MQQNRVARICQETCEARCQRKKCPQKIKDPASCQCYKEGVLYETMQ